MLGEINIYFGKVIDVTDTDKIYRVRVSIDALTDKIAKDDLPWYFPWYGLNYLPILNDVVPVIIFDNNFSTGFYARKVDLNKSELSDDDYENYLEIFKRQVSDKTVQLTYTKSKGIEFINDIGKIIILPDTLSMFIDKNSIVMTKDKITLGDKKQEATPLGDKTVKELHDIIKHQSNTITEYNKLFMQIAAACTNPFTAGIGAAISSGIPQLQIKLVKENTEVDTNADKIQSKKTFIE
jgi:hypothetical protein